MLLSIQNITKKIENKKAKLMKWLPIPPQSNEQSRGLWVKNGSSESKCAMQWTMDNRRISDEYKITYFHSTNMNTNIRNTTHSHTTLRLVC